MARGCRSMSGSGALARRPGARTVRASHQEVVMHSIESGTRIVSTPATVAKALTTVDGLRGWWTADVAHDPARGEYTFGFDRPSGRMAATFRLDRADERDVEMTCVGETRNADWLGTRLSIRLTPDGEATKVALVHAGYPARNETY